MHPQVTINISMTPEAATVSSGLISTAQDQVPQPLPLEELTAPTSLEVESTPQPLPLEELTAPTSLEVESTPQPLPLEELEKMVD